MKASFFQQSWSSFIFLITGVLSSASGPPVKKMCSPLEDCCKDAMLVPCWSNFQITCGHILFSFDYTAVVLFFAAVIKRMKRMKRPHAGS
jgi:hypothetical protein